MTPGQKKSMLVKYRLDQANETLKEAELLFNNMMTPRSVINRLYYAMYYSVLALLLDEEFASSKHKGVLSYFNKRFIKEGIFEKKMAHSINKAFELRVIGDYKENSNFTREEAEPFINLVKDFVHTIEEYIKKMHPTW